MARLGADPLDGGAEARRTAPPALRSEVDPVRSLKRRQSPREAPDRFVAHVFMEPPVRRTNTGWSNSPSSTASSSSAPRDCRHRTAQFGPVEPAWYLVVFPAADPVGSRVHSRYDAA